MDDRLTEAMAQHLADMESRSISMSDRLRMQELLEERKRRNEREATVMSQTQSTFGILNPAYGRAYVPKDMTSTIASAPPPGYAVTLYPLTILLRDEFHAPLSSCLDWNPMIMFLCSNCAQRRFMLLHSLTNTLILSFCCRYATEGPTGDYVHMHDGRDMLSRAPPRTVVSMDRTVSTEPSAGGRAAMASVAMDRSLPSRPSPGGRGSAGVNVSLDTSVSSKPRPGGRAAATDTSMISTSSSGRKGSKDKPATTVRNGTVEFQEADALFHLHDPAADPSFWPTAADAAPGDVPRCFSCFDPIVPDLAKG